MGSNNFLGAFVLARAEVVDQLQRHIHMASQREVMIINSVPLYSHSAVEMGLQMTGAQVVIVDAHADGYSMSDIQSIRRASKKPFVLVGLAQTASTQMEEMIRSEGFDILLPLPINEASVNQICENAPDTYKKLESEWGKGVWGSNAPENIRAAMAESTGQPWKRQSVVVWSPKGGVGKTTVAIETAAALSSFAGRNVALVDANMNGGHVKFRLDLRGAKNILNAASLFSMISRNDENTGNFGREFGNRVNEIMQPVAGTDNLKVITGVSDMKQASSGDIAGETGMQFISYLMDYLKQTFDFVIVDLGSSLNVGVHLGAFSKADSIAVVATPDLTGCADIKTGVDSLVAMRGLDRRRFSLVLNMWQEGLGVDIRKVAEMVGLSSIASIPMDYTGSPTWCSNHGKSYIAEFTKKKDNPKEVESTLYGFVTLAAHYYPAIAAAWSERNRKEETKKTGGKGFFKKIGKK